MSVRTFSCWLIPFGSLMYPRAPTRVPLLVRTSILVSNDANLKPRVHWSLYPTCPDRPQRVFPKEASKELLGSLLSCGIGMHVVPSLCCCVLSSRRLLNFQSFDFTIFSGRHSVYA